MQRVVFTVVSSLVILAALALAGCSTAPKTSTGRQILTDKVATAIADFKASDSSIRARFDNSYGYAIFPEVTKGGVGIGGAHGQGQLFEQGEMIGYCDVTQATIGAQLGGQVYSEVIFFEHVGALNELKSGDLEFAAQASAVAADEGASAQAQYDNGVMVFTVGESGAMLEATIGGQDFDFIPKDRYND